MEKKNLRDFLKSTGIIIPIIQRDYVQGSNSNQEKRNKFLDAIFAKLKSRKPMNLDFVYGRTVEGDGFVPVDGQQRLTTLFLLLWALANKCGDKTRTKEFEKFSYKTRVSSRRFCELLVASEYELKPGIREELQQNTRYDVSWDCDPTVLSMLDMLEELALRLEREDEDTIKDMYQRISDGAISFDGLDMSEDGFTLTDDLYIKMNARGKQLTEFENFKALMIEFVERNYSSQKEDFCTKLEYDWTQLFWNSAYEKWAQLSEEDKKKKPYPIVDDFFFNILNIITELLFFKDNGEKDTEANAFKGKFEQYEEVYANTDNFSFLINALDYLYSIAHGDKKRMHEHFSSIFYDGDSLTGPVDKVRIFSDGKSANLFDIAIEKGLDLDTKLKMLLYTYLFYSVEFPEGDVKDFMRIIRNYLESHRQKDGIKYSPEIRINRFKTYWSIIKLIAAEDPTGNLKNLPDINNFIIREKTKANVPVEYIEALHELESFKYFKGEIGNVIPSDYSDLPSFAKAVKEIWGENDTLISRALIACGFDGLYIKNCALGGTYTFGCSDNWDRILLEGPSKENDWLRVFLQKYIARKEDSPEEKINAIISDRIRNMEKDTGDWDVCFLKYPEILNCHTYYAWSNNGNYEVEGLNSTGNNPLLAYHINPYVKYVCEHKPKKSNVPWSLYRYPTGSFSSHGVEFQITDDGWKLDDASLSDDLRKKYDIDPSDNLLVPSVGQNIISVALDFIKDLS